MAPIRPRVARPPTAALLALAAPLFLAARAAAQEPAPPVMLGAVEFPVRIDADAYASLNYRLGAGGDFSDGIGGLLGGNVLAGPRGARWSAGLGYERWFLAEEGFEGGGAFTRVDRDLDALWLLGRGYPYEAERLSVYASLGVAPVWQHVEGSGAVLEPDPSGVPRARGVSCSAGDGAGLGLRIGVGAEVAITELVGFEGAIGLDHLRLSDEVIDGCAPGLGADTTLGLRLGLTLSAGRRAPAPPPPRLAAPKPPADADGDRIADPDDACPAAPGLSSPDRAKHGCPPARDTDGDGILDDADACVPEPGPSSDDPKRHGCPPPPDRDGDQVIDAEDACADLAGVPTSDPATHGCPPDTDGDGIRDDTDACKEEKGAPNPEDPTKHGCPLVVVTAAEIVITQQVQFETDRAVIRPESNALLEEVASVILKHPEILKIEVQGHTDNRGTRWRNRQLSQQRAEAVRQALLARGVAPGLLEAKGYGPDVPIADNATLEGQSKNRRVQFKIVEKKE